MRGLLVAPMLLAAASANTYLKNPCIDETAPFKDQPWCDATLTLDARIEDMLSRMNLTEKIGSLDTVSPEIISLGIPAYNW
jgi:hypothetical protein